MSLSRSEQARINGAKSRGPQTGAGKARSAANANKHNLSGKGLIILDTENDGAFQQLCQAFVDKFQPQDDLERDYLLQAAVARWRLRRIWRLETGIFNVQMLEQERRLKDDWDGLDDEIRESQAFLRKSDSLTLLNRYERAISREYERAMKAFQQARAARCEASPVPAEASSAAGNKKIQNEPKTQGRTGLAAPLSGRGLNTQVIPFDLSQPNLE